MTSKVWDPHSRKKTDIGIQWGKKNDDEEKDRSKRKKTKNKDEEEEE